MWLCVFEQGSSNFCGGPDGKYFGFCNHNVPNQLLSLPSGCNMSADWLVLTALCPRAITCCLYFRVQFSSVAQLSPTLCDPKDCSTPGLPIHHQLLEFTLTHVHWISGAIQASHPLVSPSPPAFNLSQHQCLFQWVSSLHQVAKVLEFQLQHQSFQWIFRTDFLQDGGWISLQSKGLSGVFSNTIIQKHQFFNAQLSLRSLIWLQLWLDRPFLAK